MKISNEDLWLPADIHIVTTNGTIRNHSLVMGQGAAKEAKENFPGIQLLCGRTIMNTVHLFDNVWFYGCLLVTGFFGIFQVKYKWRDKANLNLIVKSVLDLDRLARSLSTSSIRMNYPGIGAGGLSKEEVEPLIKRLPDNITICYKEKNASN